MTTITNNLDKIIIGLNKAADIVKSTMGAKGKTVIIANNNYNNNLRFTKDGVSVAKEIKLNDPIENIGAQILISAANKTVQECGDGTTLTSVLLQAMINEAIKEVENNDIKTVLKDLKVAVDEVCKKLLDIAKPIENIEQIKHIASISANSERLGNMFSEIYKQTGMEAMIHVEKSENSSHTYYEINKGIQFDSGYVHTSFMTNKDTEQAIYENAWVHIHEGKMNRIPVIVDKLVEEAVSKNNVPLIIFAEQFSDSVIRQISMSKVQQGFPICLIKTPGYGYGIKKNIDDIKSFLTPDGNISYGGYVDKIVIDSYKFILYNEDTPNLKERIKQLKSLHKNAVEWIDQDDYLKRIHKMQNTSVVVFAGGQTVVSQNEEFDRIEDAVGAIKSGIEKGFVPGGGNTLYNLSKDILLDSSGSKILSKTLQEPFRAILSNANENPDEVIKIIEKDSLYNVKTGNTENIENTIVIDPVKILITALQTAFANTELLINTSNTIYKQYDKSI